MVTYRATPAAIREHYDFFAPLYRAYWGDHIHHGLFETGDETPQQAQLKMLEHCVASVNVKRGCDVLDTSACLLPFPSDHFTVAAPAGSPQSKDRGGSSYLRQPGSSCCPLSRFRSSLKAIMRA